MVWKIVVFCLISAAAISLARALYEPRTLKVSRKSLGKGGKSIRVFLFSDIHAKYMFVPVEKITSLIVSSNADIVAFAGDMISRGDNKEKRKAKKIFSKICDACLKAEMPFFAVPGNHDIYNLQQEMSVEKPFENIVFLYNKSVSIKSSDGSEWRISGLEDLRTGFPDYEKANENNFRDNIPEIILAHNPDTILSLPFSEFEGTKERNPAAEMYEEHFKHPEKDKGTSDFGSVKNKFFLTGHFHGGQIWLPFGLEYKILRKEIMADLGYRKGPFDFKGLKGYITRGVGCTIFPFRFFSYPEVAVLDLFAE